MSEIKTQSEIQHQTETYVELSKQNYRELYEPRYIINQGSSSIIYKVIRKDTQKEYAMKCIPYTNRLSVSQSDMMIKTQK